MTTTTQLPKPSWYTAEDDTRWNKIKAAFRRDWEQTKHDFGAQAPDLNQHVGDTVAQAAGSKPIPPGNAPTPHPESYRDDDEPAYRYGYAAYHHYANGPELENDAWEDSEDRLLGDWQDKAEWERRRSAIRQGWDYGRFERRQVKPR